MPAKSDPLNKYQGKTVLVTGDTGFKGSWLSLWLSLLGANVVGYSLPVKNPEDNYSVCGLDDIVHHVDGDVRDEATILRVMKKHEPEMIFHLAAQALVLDSLQDPRYTFETNIMGTVNVFEAARRSKQVKAIVNVTSDKCYENVEWSHGYRETDRLGGKDPYSASKGAAEIVSSSYARTFFDKKDSAAVATVRAGNVIGGGDWAANRIVPDCIRALQSSLPIRIRNPDAVRPWQHVLDPLYGYLRLGAFLMDGEKRYSGAWNFGPAHHSVISVKRLVEEVIDHWGTGGYVVDEEPTSHEAGFLQLDISKSVKELAWYPLMDFPLAVKRTVEEYRIGDRAKRKVRQQRLRHIREYMDRRKRFERERYG